MENKLLDLIQEALERKDVDDVVSDDGKTVLHIIAKHHPEFLEQGFELVEDINRKDKLGWSVLHILSICGDTKMLELALSYGANVNDKTNSGDTPLHLLISMNKDYRPLLKYGANMNEPNNKDVTPFMILTHYATTEEDYKYLDLSKIDLNFSGKSGNVLHFVNTREVFLYLLDKGVDINNVDSDGNTVIFKTKYYNIFLESLKKEINLTLRNKKGHSIFDHIILESTIKNESKNILIRDLIFYGANMFNKNLIKYLIEGL